MTAPVEAEALAFARELVTWHRSNSIPLFGTQVTLLDEGSTQKFGIEVLKAHAEFDPTIAELAVMGWRLGDTAVRELIGEMQGRGAALPAHLAAYDAKHSRLRGREGATNVLRNIAITVIVGQVVERFGLKPTRKGAKQKSASSVVSEALVAERINCLTGEKAVEEIWRRYKRMWLPSA